MATQLFATNTNAESNIPWSFYPGRNVTLLDGTAAMISRPKQLSTSRGGGVLSSEARATVTGPTGGLEYRQSASEVLSWITPPIDADVTISGNVTFNVWGLESSMNANCGPQVIVERIDSIGQESTIINSEANSEWGTSAGVKNWASAPTSTACLKGDRLRIRIGFNDVGTMASGFTSTLRYNGTTGGADGDTYVSFDETFGFQTTDPTGSTVYLTDTLLGIESSGDTGFVQPGLAEHIAGAGSDWTNPSQAIGSDNVYATNVHGGGQSDPIRFTQFGFSIPDGSYIRGISVDIEGKTSTGTATITGRLVNGGSVISANRTAGLLTTTEGTITAGNDLWGETVLTESDVEGSTFGVELFANAIAMTISIDAVRMKVFYGSTPGKAREAWTSRGAGVQNDTTLTANGPTVPIQVTDTTTSQLVEWYTKPLQAFTLSGVVLVNERSKTSDGVSDAGIRTEIAVCNEDASSPTVWGSNQQATETNTTETAYNCYVSGDDISVSDGQRVRIRWYIDDAWGTMESGQTITSYYAGTSAAASGDSYLIFPQTLSEFVGGADERVPRFSPYPQLLAH